MVVWLSSTSSALAAQLDAVLRYVCVLWGLGWRAQELDWLTEVFSGSMASCDCWLSGRLVLVVATSRTWLSCSLKLGL